MASINKYAVILLMLMCLSAHGDTLVVYDGQTGGSTEDATLNHGQVVALGYASYCDDPYLDLRNGSSDNRYILLRFPGIDSATVPAWSDTTVQIRLKTSEPLSGAFGDWTDTVWLYAYAVNKGWAEYNDWGGAGISDLGVGSPTWKVRLFVSDTTYDTTIVSIDTLDEIVETTWEYDTTWDTTITYWSTSLLFSDPLDGVSGAAFDTVAVDTIAKSWITINVPDSLFYSWRTNSAANYGILLASAGNGTDDDGDHALRRFYSSEYGVDSIAPQVFIGQTDERATFHVINSNDDLPYTTVGTYDTVFIAVDSLAYTSPGAAITLAHAHSKLLLNGHTLFVDSLGIQISADSCKVYNGTIEQRAEATRQKGVMINIANNLDSCEIRDVNVHARTASSGGLRAGGLDNNSGGCKSGLLVYGGNYTSYVTDFDTREYAFTAPIGIYDNGLGNQSVLHARVSHVTVDSCPHIACQINGGILWVDSCNFTVDNQNHYTYPSSDIMEGTSNAFCIGIDRIGGHCRIFDNVLRSGTHHGGGRGIDCHGQSSHWTQRFLEIYDNDIRIHVGPDAYYGGGEQSSALRVRDSGTDTLYVHDNYVLSEADTATSTAYMGPKATALWLSQPGIYWRFENNTFRAMGVAPFGVRYAHNGVHDNDTAGFYARAVVFDMGDGGDWPDSTIFRGNRIESNVIPISWGEVNSNSADNCGSNIHSFNDTINRVSPYIEDNWGNNGAIVLSLGSCNFYDNYMTDLVCESDSTIDWDGSGPGEIWLRKTLDVQVVDSVDAPVSNARVRIRDPYRTEFCDTTDVNGEIPSFVAKYRLYQYSQTDSTYNPFAIDVITNISTTKDSSATEKIFGLTTSGSLIIVASGGEAEPPTPCVASQSLTVSDTKQTSVNCIDTYTYDTDSTLTKLRLVWDDDNNIASPLGYEDKTSGFGSPDTLRIDSLTMSTQYWYWWILTAGGCKADTSAAGTFTTDGPAEESGGSLTINAPVVIGTSTVFDDLAIPMDKSVVQDGRIHVFAATSHDEEEDANSIRSYYSADSGITWHGVAFDIDAGYSDDYHLAIFGQPGVGIHLVGMENGSVGGVYYRGFYRFIASPGTSVGNADPERMITPTANWIGTVAARGDTSWTIFRSSDDRDSLDVRMSLDEFATTPTNVSRTFPGLTAESRLGVFTEPSGLPVLFRWTDAAGIYKLPWHGPTGVGFYGDADSVVTASGNDYWERAMTYAYADGGWHCIVGRINTNGARLVEYREVSGSWITDTLIRSTNFNSGITFAPKACVRNDSIFMVVGTATTSAPNPTSCGLMIFDPVTDTWSAVTAISGTDVVDASMQVPSRVPDNFPIVPVFYAVDGGTYDTLKCVRVEVTGGSTSETISTPSVPSGPSTGEADSTLTFTASGSSSSEGHELQYRFDWGDATFSDWSYSASASRSFPVGTYSIKAQARCAGDTDQVSSWSSGLGLTVTGPVQHLIKGWLK